MFEAWLENSSSTVRKSDTEIRSDGFRLLLQHFSNVDAERFLAMVNRERFDYTQWRSQQWSTGSVASLAVKARSLRQKEN